MRFQLISLGCPRNLPHFREPEPFLPWDYSLVLLVTRNGIFFWVPWRWRHFIHNIYFYQILHLHLPEGNEFFLFIAAITRICWLTLSQEKWIYFTPPLSISWCVIFVNMYNVFLSTSISPMSRGNLLLPSSQRKMEEADCWETYQPVYNTSHFRGQQC